MFGRFCVLAGFLVSVSGPLVSASEPKAPQLVWSRLFGTAESDTAFSSSVDRFGNVLTTGTTVGALPGNQHNGGQDGFLASLMQFPCQHQSFTQWGDDRNDTPWGICADARGYVHLVGNRRGIDRSKGYYQQHDPFGRLLRREFFAADDLTVFPRNCTIDACGNVFVVGGAHGNSSWGFVAKLSRSGETVTVSVFYAVPGSA